MSSPSLPSPLDNPVRNLPFLYIKEYILSFYKPKNIQKQPDNIIETKLEILNEVGLSYIKLGQNATTLSGGEAQRIKLAKELIRRDTGKTLYVLDEPTTGLHFHDVAKLLQVLNKLKDRGNTLIVIEHNLEVIKTADWIIDLGPEGGSGGGEIISEGTPETVAKNKKSYTGMFLNKKLN